MSGGLDGACGPLSARCRVLWADAQRLTCDRDPVERLLLVTASYRASHGQPMVLRRALAFRAELAAHHVAFEDRVLYAGQPFRRVGCHTGVDLAGQEAMHSLYPEGPGLHGNAIHLGPDAARAFAYWQSQPLPPLWKLLWDKDPNGLLVLDAELRVRHVNAAFCRMFKTTPPALLGSLAAEWLDDVGDFRIALAQGSELKAQERAYPRHDLYVRKVIFAIPEERIVAGIFVDLTAEWRHNLEFSRLKREAIQEVRQVVDKQMKVAQEIAGLLGETTAETKVSLLRLLEMLQREEKPATKPSAD